MADQSDPQAKKAVIIAGDDGNLYHLSHDELQAHKMDPSHPAHEHAQKLVAEEQHGTITPEHFKASGATANADIWITFFNQNAVKPPEK